MLHHKPKKQLALYIAKARANQLVLPLAVWKGAETSSVGAVLTVHSEVEGSTLGRLQIVRSCAVDGTNQVCSEDTCDRQCTGHSFLQYDATQKVIHKLIG